MSNPQQLAHLLKYERWPTMWCPGCGLGIVTHAIAEVMDKNDLDSTNTAMVSGIGCTARASGYFKLDSINGTHGRAIAIAEGVKAAQPRMNVIVFSGDGDLLGIGGNHLIHSARRNTNLTVLLNANEIYGLTGGQLSPASPKGTKTVTSPTGSEYYPIDIQKLLVANHNYFYARSSTWHLAHLRNVIIQAIQWPGFALVDIRSYCFENYGRRLGFKKAPEMLIHLKELYKIKRNLGEGELLADDELGIVSK